MSSDIIYKDRELLVCGIGLLTTLSDKMFDIAIKQGHDDFEPIIIFISSMQSSAYFF